MQIGFNLRQKALSNALKTAINSVYGLASASFDNQFIPTAAEMRVKCHEFDSPYGRGVRFARAVEYDYLKTKKSYKTIAKDIGVSYSTLYKWMDGGKINEKYYPAIESVFNHVGEVVRMDRFWASQTFKMDWIFDGYPAYDPRASRSLLYAQEPELPYCNLEDYQTWFLNYISQAEINFKDDIEKARQEIKSWDLPKKEDKV